MGKAAGAAVTAAAPEAKAAQLAGKALGAARNRTPKKITPDMSPGQVNDELQARRAARASGPPTPSPTPAAPSTTPTAPAPTSSGAGLSVPAPVGAAAATGGGFLLGLFAWALGLAYLRGGSAEVKKLLTAKFLNKTTSGGAAGGSSYLNGMTAEQMQNAVAVAQALGSHPEASAPGTVLGNLSQLNVPGINALGTLNGHG